MKYVQFSCLRVTFLAIAWAICLVSGAGSAQGQTFPSKALRIVSPYAPGGGNDVVARAVGARLSQKLGQPVIIENRAGANGMLGADYVAKQPADGYTIILVPTQHVYNAGIYEKLPFDPINDFTPISLLGSAPLLVAVRKGAPFKNVKELIEYAKRRPANDVTYSTAGAGSGGHLAGAMLAQALGLKLQHIPYKGAAPAAQALLTEEVMLSISPPSALLTFLRSDKIAAIGMTGAKRSLSAPDIPTIVEQGVTNFDAGLWYGFLGPAKMPREIVVKLNSAINAVVNEKEMRDVLAKAGVDVATATPEDFGRLLVKDTARWAPIVKAAGLKAE